METGGVDHLSKEQQKPNIEVVGSIGLAKELFEKKGTLKSYNAWFGIITREKTYPDSKVMDFAKWGSKNCNNFLIIIADETVNPHNIIAMGNRRVTYDHMPELTDTFRELAEKRREMLDKLIHKERLTNVQVKLWGDVLYELSTANSKSWYFIHMGGQLFDRERHVNEAFEQRLRSITREKIGKELERAKKRKGKLPQVPIWGYISRFSNEMENVGIEAIASSDDPKDKAWAEELKAAKKRFGEEYVEFAAATYAKEEVFIIWALATFGNYPIKVGPPGERIYDEFALDLIKEGKPIKIKGAQFGAVYLK